MIIDSHTHVVPEFLKLDRAAYLDHDTTFGTLHRNAKIPLATSQDLLESMDEEEVDAAVMVGFGWTNKDLATAANDDLLEQSRKSGGRLIPFCSVNPNWGKAAIEEVERCAIGGAKGIGELHPDTQGFNLTDYRIMEPLVEIALKHNLAMLIHTSEPVGHQYVGKGTVTPEVIFQFIEHFPGVNIILAHFGGGLPFYALMPEVKSSLANVYFDSAAAPFLYTPNAFRVTADLVGIDRILMGSDFPLIHTKRLVNEVLQSGLSTREQALVLGENAARLYNISIT